MKNKMLKPGPGLTQFATVNSLLVGLYDGLFPVSQICSHGNFGLGCPDAMEGEMLINEGECYVAPAGRQPRLMGQDEKVAFAQMAWFEPSHCLSVSDIRDKDRLAEILIEQAETANLFIGFRLKGTFSTVKIRQPPSGLAPPYPPLVDVLRSQTEMTYTGMQGTILGFWTPPQYQGTSVAGIHIHFLDDRKLCGGHVMDISITEGQLEIQLYHRFDLYLPTESVFLDADLNYENADEHIRTAEG
ncbi:MULTISPECIES: acetolactate decarboxylase [Klebsiella/Raoultella group]|uniref:acetolactate decarboxylase n=1 Tax=Klebsiella/Raoultella group TaxID=2890311 RepID=UPI001163BE40|nr:MULTISPECIES: acetolactate decarboxylase [Klebsiella/Raoultella group]EKK7729359.1 acetolactate decarboxylase [Cronobacter sakazakii]ELY5800331.1 acetolactate decarboxylase [Cronobacter sakazakii]MCE0051627.1 acetolactate decarboxylase [Klebsiella quasipneumoniae subsp. quasipneumoniae]VUC78391.1 alpha-acetolactate decarboxylase [Raoultella terrigena]GKI71348.1 acetolactate decarboxylase [Klebsiella variicola]